MFKRTKKSIKKHTMRAALRLSLVGIEKSQVGTHFIANLSKNGV
nr:hypothetical protein [Ornithobacterium rhinotracheale]